MGRMHKMSERDFQTCLDKIVEDNMGIEELHAQNPEISDSFKRELEAATWLRDQIPVLEPVPDFIADSKRRLLARIGETIVPKSSIFAPVRQRFFWGDIGFGSLRKVTQWALVIVLIVVTVYNFSRLGRAAQTWLPGDHLYALKSTREAAELGLAQGEVSQARLHIRFARQRLIEIQALVLENRFDEIPPTVAEFGQHVDSSIQAMESVARDDPHAARRLLVELQSVLSSQADFVMLLADCTPQNTQHEIQRVITNSKAIVTQVEDALAPGSGMLAPRKLSLQNCWVSAD